MQKIKEFIAGLITRTDNPMAPMIFESAYNAAEQMGKIMAPLADRAKTDAIAEQIMGQWPNDEVLNELSASPEWIVVLSSMLKESLVGFAKKAKEG